MKNSDELAREARSNNYNFMSLDFLRENLKDPSLAEGYLKRSINQAKKNAIILGSVLIISLISVVFGIVQQTVAQSANRRAENKKEELIMCQNETEKQRASALEAQMIYEEANKMAEEALLKCKQQKR
jgi:Zn-dependent membrane protease YugP